VLGFVEKRPLLASLIEDDRIYEPIEDLLGPGFMWIGSDGNLYVGDTAWHSDSRPDPIEYGYTKIKVALYLEPVTKETGCLRVIPGSHTPPMHEELEPMRHLREMQSDYAGKTKSSQEVAGEHGGQAPSVEPFGVPSYEMPGFALESQPGDAVFFNHRIWHSSFGGWTGRRMFTLNFGQKPITEDHFKLVRMGYESSLEAARKMQHTWTDQLYTDGFLNSERPRVMSMMATAAELGLR
jgi:ectoine hydroxylase-related dioxygenase (phytanoyl-CoA dioxygenase family)